MSSEKLRLRAGELYTRDEVCRSLECGKWLVDVLVSLFGLTRLGGKVTFYEGGDVITALRRHALNDVVSEDFAQGSSATKSELERLKREREKKRRNGTK